MTAVNLNAVISGGKGAQSRLYKLLFYPLNLLFGHGPPYFCFSVLLAGIVTGAEIFRPDAHNPGMVQLDKNRAAFIMRGIHDFFQALYLSVLPNAQLVPAEAAFPADAGGLLNDQPGAALGDGPVMGNILFADPPCHRSRYSRPGAARKSGSSAPGPLDETVKTVFPFVHLFLSPAFLSSSLFKTHFLCKTLFLLVFQMI